MKEGTNYARFYALLKKLKGADKETLVYQFTNGRTEHLRLMTEAEYGAMCREMERVAGYDERSEAIRRELRRWRSTCLRLMQQMGIDTTDWARVDDFCRNPRIAGKPFARISQPELEALSVKLRSIRRKGGLKRPAKPELAPRQEYVIVNMTNNEKAN
ncbi:hypothetical protein [Prevotella marseillensis]|jgi:hypothetical protein|uniref:hypothetical protein n=1 Tax=Prevotella marseillensis TaxID=2479840 RepID=UPI000F62F16B|nr:hypothetical protein [Prevotella marseillensis]